MKKRFLALLLMTTMIFLALATPIMAANASGVLTAVVEYKEDEPYLTLTYTSGNNSIKAAIFEVLTPDGKTLLLNSPVIQFDFKSCTYSFKLESDIPANAVIKLTENKANKPEIVTSIFKEGFELPGIAKVGNLQDFEDALLSLGNNPGMTLRFTSNITLTPEWIKAHNANWFDETEAGGYVEVFEDDDIGTFAMFMFFNTVNIDLGEYTWDLSMLTSTGIFEDPEYGVGGGIWFGVSSDDPLPYTMSITNGTIKANYIYFDLTDVDELNLTDTFITNAEIRIYSPDDGAYILYDPAIHTNVNDNHKSN